MNFVYIYVISAAIRHYEILPKLDTKWLLGILFLGIGSTFTGLVLTQAKEFPVAFTAYNSPFVVLTAGAVFCLFGKLEIQKTWINKIAMSVLPVYLLSDGGNLSKLFYQWSGEIANTYSHWNSIGIFIVTAMVLIISISLLDQIRLWFWLQITKTFPKYLKK